MKPLSCEEIGFFLDGLLRAELEPADADALQAHLADCAGCRAQVEELLWLERTLDETAAFAGIDQLAARIRAVLVETEASTPQRRAPCVKSAGPPARRSLPSVRLWWITALAAAVLLAIGGLAIHGWLGRDQAIVGPIAHLEHLQGEVYVMGREGRTPAQAGQKLYAGEGLATAGEGSLALVKFVNAAQLELGPETVVDQLPMQLGPFDQLVVSQGVLTVRQPRDRPLVLNSANAEVVVQGTTFSYRSAPDQDRIEVEAGAGARLTRKSDGQSIDVKAGQSAVACSVRPPAADLSPPTAEPFVSRPLPPSFSAVRTTVQDPNRPLFHVAFSADGTMLATASRKLVTVWDTGAWKPKFVLKGHGDEVRCAVFSPDSRTVATASDDKSIRLWDLATGELRVLLQGHGGRVNSAAFSADGRLLATGAGHWSDKGEVFLWDAASGERRATLEGHKRGVLAVTFSPDGRTLVSGSHDNTIKLWDPALAREVLTLKGHRDGVSSVAFSPDGRRLVSASRFHDRTVRIWDLAAGKEQLSLPGHLHSVNCVAFSPDGQLLASCSDDKTVILWDPISGKERVTLRGHNNAVTSLAFAPDGKTLATVTAWDRLIKLWDAFPGQNANEP